MADLAKLLAAEEQALGKLRAKREALDAQLDELAGVIAQLRGERVGKPVAAKRGKKRGRRRARGGITLRAAIAKVLSDAGKPVRAADIATQIGSTGFQTSSKNLKNMISATLAQAKDFKRVGKGLYALKK